MPDVVKVAVAHQASYADPISVGRGDAIVLTGRRDIWDGHCWIWAIDSGGREGWIPDDLTETDAAGTVCARRDYDAIELTCVAGEALVVVEASHGWAWCRNASGAEGWVPLRNLAA